MDNMDNMDKLYGRVWTNLDKYYVDDGSENMRMYGTR